jgi:hypothetical protein
MKQRPSWETNSCSASQEILHSLWNTKVHYRIYKIQLLIPTLTQMNTVHTLTHSFS